MLTRKFVEYSAIKDETTMYQLLWGRDLHSQGRVLKDIVEKGNHLNSYLFAAQKHWVGLGVPLKYTTSCDGPMVGFTVEFSFAVDGSLPELVTITLEGEY